MLSKSILNSIKQVAEVVTELSISHLSKTKVTLQVTHMIADQKVGDSKYAIYENSINGRRDLLDYFNDYELPTDYLDTIMTLWGETPLIREEELTATAPDGL